MQMLKDLKGGRQTKSQVSFSFKGSNLDATAPFSTMTERMFQHVWPLWKSNLGNVNIVL